MDRGKVCIQLEECSRLQNREDSGGRRPECMQRGIGEIPCVLAAHQRVRPTAFAVSGLGVGQDIDPAARLQPAQESSIFLEGLQSGHSAIWTFQTACQLQDPSQTFRHMLASSFPAGILHSHMSAGSPRFSSSRKQVRAPRIATEQERRALVQWHQSKEVHVVI